MCTKGNTKGVDSRFTSFPHRLDEVFIKHCQMKQIFKRCQMRSSALMLQNQRAWHTRTCKIQWPHLWILLIHWFTNTCFEPTHVHWFPQILKSHYSFKWMPNIFDSNANKLAAGPPARFGKDDLFIRLANQKASLPGNNARAKQNSSNYN